MKQQIIVSKERVEMKEIESLDKYINKFLTRDNLFEDYYRGLQNPSKMSSYLDDISTRVCQLKEMVKRFDQNYYVLDGKIEYDHSTQKYNVLEMKLKFITHKFDSMAAGLETTEYSKMLKLSKEDIDNWYYTKYGVYYDSPLYIHDNIKKLLDAGFELKMIQHGEIRGVTEEIVQGYKKVTEHYWFFDGIALIGDGKIFTDATTGKYNKDWFGISQKGYKEYKINGEVKFIMKK